MSSVQGKRSNQLCAICEKHSSTRRGEHVLPSWLLQDLFPASEGPFTTHINGTPVPNRYGEPRQSDHLKRILLPMCNRETGGRCNGTLDTRFETNVARAAVRAMFGGRDLTSPEAHAAGIWWLKTMLLSKHPRAEAADVGPAHPVWAEPVDPLLYSWMVDGAAPPPYVSVWVSRQGDSADAEPGNDLDVDRIMLPWFERDGTTYRSRVGLLGVRELLVTLLVHPGWNTTHPLEGTGQALRIYPSTGALAMTDLVDCDSRGRKGWGSVFAGAVRLMLADDCDPLSHPWTLGPCWDRSFAQDLPGVVGASWG